MGDPGLDPLIRDLLEWVAHAPRTQSELLEVWRTSCPRLTVWEDAIDRGLLAREHHPGHAPAVTVTAAGLDFLRRLPSKDRSAA